MPPRDTSSVSSFRAGTNASPWSRQRFHRRGTCANSGQAAEPLGRDDSRTDAWRTDGSQPHSRRKNPPRGSTDGPLRGQRRGCGASEKTGDLGFEPRLTESESVVLPLHQSPRHRNCIGFPRRVHSEAGDDFLVPITGWASALGRNRARSRGWVRAFAPTAGRVLARARRTCPSIRRATSFAFPCPRKRWALWPTARKPESRPAYRSGRRGPRAP